MRFGVRANKSWRRVVVGLRSVVGKGEGCGTESEMVIFCDGVVLRC